MLLDEDPATLIHHTINNFNTAPDKQTISRIHDSLSTLKQARDLRIRDAENSLKKLGRTLNALHNQHEELVAAHSPQAHAAEISQLDTQKFRTAKDATALEVETEHLSAQLADLQARLQELEIQGVEGGAFADEAARRRDPIDDEVLLRLKVYRSLGIELERDDEPARKRRSRGPASSNEGGGGDDASSSGIASGTTGEFSRAIIRNDRKGDVHVVTLDKNVSRYYYAKHFWQNL